MEHAVVVVHDSLQLVCRHLVVGKTLVHTCLLIILTIIGSVGKHRTDAYLRIEFLEYLVVAKQHGDRLYGKQSVEISIVGRFVEVVEDKLCYLPHALLLHHIHVAILLVVFHQKAQNVLVGYGILDEIAVETGVKHLGCGMFASGILREYWCASEAEYL